MLIRPSERSAESEINKRAAVLREIERAEQMFGKPERDARDVVDYWKERTVVWRRIAWVYFLMVLLLFAVLALQYSREITCRLS